MVDVQQLPRTYCVRSAGHRLADSAWQKRGGEKLKIYQAVQLMIGFQQVDTLAVIAR